MSHTTVSRTKRVTTKPHEHLDVCRIVTVYQQNHNISYAFTGIFKDSCSWVIIKFCGPKLAQLITQITTIPGTNPEITDDTLKQLLHEIEAKVVMFRKDEETKRQTTLYIQGIPALHHRCRNLLVDHEQTEENLDIFQPIRLHTSA